jgi:GxxExxY protein
MKLADVPARLGYMTTEILFKAESYKIVGACFEVYREKGCGFLEPVYQECMEIESRLQGISQVPKKSLTLEYRGCPLRSTYEPDFICYDKILLELKAVTELTDEHRAQVQNYLKATGLKLGLLVNFGHQRRKWNVSWLNADVTDIRSRLLNREIRKIRENKSEGIRSRILRISRLKCFSLINNSLGHNAAPAIR